jgi:hypothetical protein
VETREAPGFQLYLSELEEVFNRLYREAMNERLSSEERVMKLEQQRGVALAINLMDNLLAAYDGFDVEEENKPEEIVVYDGLEE